MKQREERVVMSNNQHSMMVALGDKVDLEVVYGYHLGTFKSLVKHGWYTYSPYKRQFLLTKLGAHVLFRFDATIVSRAYREELTPYLETVVTMRRQGGHYARTGSTAVGRVSAAMRG